MYVQFNLLKEVSHLSGVGDGIWNGENLLRDLGDALAKFLSFVHERFCVAVDIGQIFDEIFHLLPLSRHLVEHRIHFLQHLFGSGVLFVEQQLKLSNVAEMRSKFS